MIDKKTQFQMSAMKLAEVDVPHLIAFLGHPIVMKHGAQDFVCTRCGWNMATNLSLEEWPKCDEEIVRRVLDE